jgi:hypothetical protein
MLRVRRRQLSAVAVMIVLLSIAVIAFLSLRPSPERRDTIVLVRGGDTVAFEGGRGLPFEVRGDVTVTIRGQWTATVPTAVTPDCSFRHWHGWPANLPRTIGGAIDYSAVFQTSLPSGGSNYANGVGPVTCSLVLYSPVPDSMTAVTDIVVTYTYS